MITLITPTRKSQNTQNPEYVYANVSYTELNNTIIKHHLKMKQFFVVTDFKVMTRPDADDFYEQQKSHQFGPKNRPKYEFKEDPNATYADDAVPSDIIRKAKEYSNILQKQLEISELVVGYKNLEFSGSLETQTKILIAIEILNNPTSLSNYSDKLSFIYNNGIVKLNAVEFRELLTIISNKQEIILNS